MGAGGNIGCNQPLGDHLRIAIDLLERLRKGLARPFVLEQEQRSLTFHNDLHLLDRKFIGLDFQLPILVLTRKVRQFLGLVSDRFLEIVHSLETGLQIDQCPFDLLFTQLRQDAFEFSDCLLKFLFGFLLFLNGILSLVFTQFLLRLLHPFASPLNPFASLLFARWGFAGGGLGFVRILAGFFRTVVR